MSDRVLPPHVHELEMPTWPQHTFAAALKAYWAQIVWLVGGVSIIATTVVSLLGLRISGPRDAFALGEKRDSANAVTDSLLAVRVGRLEQGAVKFQRSLTFQSYLLCKQTSRADPVARDRCDTIIADMLAQGTP